MMKENCSAYICINIENQDPEWDWWKSILSSLEDKEIEIPEDLSNKIQSHIT